MRVFVGESRGGKKRDTSGCDYVWAALRQSPNGPMDKILEKHEVVGVFPETDIAKHIKSFAPLCEAEGRQRWSLRSELADHTRDLAP